MNSDSDLYVASQRKEKSRCGRSGLLQPLPRHEQERWCAKHGSTARGATSLLLFGDPRQVFVGIGTAEASVGREAAAGKPVRFSPLRDSAEPSQDRRESGELGTVGPGH